MKQRTCLIAVACLMADGGVAIATAQARRHEGRRPLTKVTIDAADRSATVAGDDRVYLAGEEIVLPRPGRMVAQVRGRNSALYACTLKVEKRPLADRDSLGSFLAVLGPYLPVLAGAVMPPIIPSLVAVAEAQEVREKAMYVREQALDDAVRSAQNRRPPAPATQPSTTKLLDSIRTVAGSVLDPDGVRAIEHQQDQLATALGALDDLAHESGGIADFRGLVSRGVADFARTKSASDIEQVKQDVQRRWDSTCQKFGCTEAERLDVLRARLAVVAATARDLRALRGVNRHKADSMADIHRDSANKILADLKDIKTDSQIGHPEIFRQRLDSLGSYGRQRAKLLALEPAGKLLDAAAIALGDEPKLRQLIIAIAQLRTDIGEATDIVVCDPVEVLADTLRILTVTAAPRTLAAFATVRLEDPLEFGFVTTPGRVFRLAVGLSFLVASKAIYPTFGTKMKPDSTFTVIQSGNLDNRASYGLSLSVGFPRLNPRNHGKWAFWMPEITVNPADGVKSVGLGFGVSYSVIKLGAGRLWTRHDLLAPENPLGTILPNPEALRTISSFRQSRWYVGLSLIGLPPFIRSGS